MANAIRVVVALVAGLLLTTFTADLARLPPLPAALGDIAYLRSGLSYAIDIIGMIVLLRFVGGVRLRDQWEMVGLSRPWRPAVLMGVLLFAPLVLAGIALGTPTDDETVSSLFFLGVFAPFAEEVTYRGMAIGALMGWAGWRFGPAALLPAVVFGFAHAAQGDGLQESAMIAAITAVGGLFFGWLYLRFGRNLWPAIVMHVGINLLWNMFDFGANAVGDVLGNVLRAASVLGAIAFAIRGRAWLERRSGSLPAD